jgi:hypothetical protein
MLYLLLLHIISHIWNESPHTFLSWHGFPLPDSSLHRYPFTITQICLLFCKLKVIIPSKVWFVFHNLLIFFKEPIKSCPIVSIDKLNKSTIHILYMYFNLAHLQIFFPPAEFPGSPPLRPFNSVFILHSAEGWVRPAARYSVLLPTVVSTTSRAAEVSTLGKDNYRPVVVAE